MNMYRPTEGVNDLSKQFIISYETFVDALNYIAKQHHIISMNDALFSSFLTNETVADPSGDRSIRILADGSITPSTYLIDETYIVANITEPNVLDKIEKSNMLTNLIVKTIPSECKGCAYENSCAGGVYDRNDIEHYISLGCSGVQMATRFVATEECDAHINFKMAYINSKKEDIMIVKSPVGMPGRAISNKFMEERKLTNEKINKCYKCLKKCDMATIPYCITGALVRAVKGDVENSLVFCGENAYRLDKITTVKELIQELTY